jgi:hypothetical protein
MSKSAIENGLWWRFSNNTLGIKVFTMFNSCMEQNKCLNDDESGR